MTTYNNKWITMPRKSMLILVTLIFVLLGHGKAWGDVTATWDYVLDFTQQWAKDNIQTSSTTLYVSSTTAEGVPTLSDTQPEGDWMKVVGKYHGTTYGIYNAHFYVPVKAGRYTVTLGTSDYGGDILVTDGTNTITTISNSGGKYASDHNNVASGTFNVNSDCTLDIYNQTNPGGVYYPYFAIKQEEPEPEPEPGWTYNKTVSSVSELTEALSAANGKEGSPYKIFLKNGTYDLGTTFDTKVKDYTTLIGESRDGVIIQNSPKEEGIWTSATLRTGSHVVMQNLTLHSQVTYNASTSAERGTSLYDEGSNNVYMNIRLLGRQDTYYSTDNTNSYFENCEIHGTVDFICGSGNAWFEKCTILIEERSAGAVIVAPRSNTNNTETYKGYFFNHCTIDNAADANMSGKYYLGRGWTGQPKTVFADCTYNIAYKGSDGYDRENWAAGSADGNDNSGMTKQDAALTNSSETMGDVATSATPLPAPTTVSFDTATNTLTWSRVNGAVAYAIYDSGSLLEIVNATEDATQTYTVASASAVSLAITARGASATTSDFSVAAISEEGIVGETANSASTYKEKVIYKTDFTNWVNANATSTPVSVTKTTKDGQSLVFTMQRVEVNPQGTHEKLTSPCITEGFLKAEKKGAADPEAYIETSPLASIYKVKYVHGATGSDRGWGLQVKGDGDADWVTVYSKIANPSAGQEVEVIVDRKNARLRFYNLAQDQYAFMTSLEIYDMVEVTPRTFTDFKIDFRSESYKVLLPESGSLPTGVEVTSGKWHQDKHGYENAAIKVPVDGAVKFTIGGCTFTNQAKVTNSKGETLDTLDTNSAGCDSNTSFEHYVEFLYNSEEADVLTFDLGSYCPFFFAEQADYVADCEITYIGTDGTVLKNVIVRGNTGLKFDAEAESLVDVPVGSKFRGWFAGSSATAQKVAEGKSVNDDMRLYAKVTPIEKLYDGNSYLFDLTKSYFYVEDHDIIRITNGKYWNDHGWTFDSNARIELDVTGKTKVTLTMCQYGSSGTIQLKSGENNVGSPITLPTGIQGSDKTTAVIDYDGPETTLWFDVPKGSYLHAIEVTDVSCPIVSFVNKFEGTLLGTVPEDIVAKSNKAFIPENQLLYREGWTVTGWTDGENKYPLKSESEFLHDVTLYPVLHKNTQELSDNNTDGLKAVWYFDQLDGAPAINMYSSSTIKQMTYTKCISVNGEMHDVPLVIDARLGKIDNTDARVNALGTLEKPNVPVRGGQINDNTLLSLPAVYGMKVTFQASLKVDQAFSNNTTTFTDGNEIGLYEGDVEVASVPFEISEDKRTITYTYNGDATTLTLKIKKGGSADTFGYFTKLEVEYPVLPDVVGENLITTTPLYTNDNGEVIEKHANAGDVTITRVSSDVSHANTGTRFKVGDVVTISASANYGYNVTGFRVKGAENNLTANPVESTSAPSANFIVVDGITTIEVLYERQPMYKVTATMQLSAGNKALGEVSLSPKYENFYTTTEDGDIVAYYTEATEVTASAEAIAEYVIDKWTDGASETAISNSNAYSFTMGKENKTLKAYFKEGYPGNVIFKIIKSDDSGIAEDATNIVNGVTPAYNNAGSLQPDGYSNVKSFTVPTNFTIFKNVDDNKLPTENSYTLQHWKGDDGNIYELGKVYSFAQQDHTLTLTPVFQVNPATQANRLNNPVIRYDFGTGLRTYDDPTSGETRKVCAQEVRIGNNKNVFWTSEVYAEVLENGKKLPHWRDVAMWVNTGKNGYIRNGDLPEWAAFGPGTTFWIASCAGTKFSLLTYAPITSTTIDGHVPTLDTEDSRCKPQEHQYVYSYTTNNTDLRIPLVIGDDYSYYQWIEAATLAANMVRLNSVVDDDARGAVTKIESTSSYEAVEQEDGSYTFNQGNRVRMTFKRNFGFEFDKIIDPDKIVNGEPLAVLKKNSDGTVDMVKPNNAYEVVRVEMNEDGTWGTEDGDDATVFTLKETRTEDNRTVYEVQFNITTHRNLVVCFKEKPTYYITYNAGKFASGVAPVAQWVEEDDKYTVANNRTLYYEGNTLAYWIDSEYDDEKTKEENAANGHVYEIGQTYKAKNENIRLFPVFKVNNFNILDIDNMTAVWNFATQDGAPTMAYERSGGILVTQVKKNESSTDWIDLKIDLNANIREDKDNKYGKFNNMAYEDRIQINANSLIYFPNTHNCVVEMTATSNDVQSVNVAGLVKGNDGFTIGNNSVSVTSSSYAATETVDFLAGCYGIDFSVTYKKQETTKPTLASLSIGGVELSSENLAGLITNKIYNHTLMPTADEDVVVPVVTGTATNDGVVTATVATIDKPVSTVTVSTAGGVIVETYTINFGFSPSSNPANIPHIMSVKVNGKLCELTETTHLANQPVNGVIEIEFSRTMEATSFDVNENGYNATLSAEQGKTLRFRYWELPVGKTFNISLSNVFTDIYGMTCTEAVNLSITSATTSIPVIHRTFNYIVGTDGDIDGAIEAANAATGSDRYYIFVPDGAYKLTGNDPLGESEYKQTSDGVWPSDEDGNPRNDMAGKNNGRTTLRRPNVSLIGQSQKGVQIYNHPIVEGIGYTSTLHTAYNATDLYVEDLTLENRFDYWRSMDSQGSGIGAGRAVVFWDQGNRSIMKNVELWSWQDTYYSANDDSSYRGYFEKCVLAGVVDWLCGSGDIWIENSDIIIRDRSGNNIAAPATSSQQQWGYVFNNCRIKPETEKPEKLKGNDWTLARPWNAGNGGKSPACTYINTRMSIQPRIAGWGVMSDACVLRFHEYETMDGNGNLLSLGARSLVASNPAAGSDDCILTAAQAAEYTIRAVMGGTDSFDPVSLTKQIDAKSATEGTDPENHMIWDDQIELDDDRLQWKTEPMALCYFVFKKNEVTGKWEYRTNVAQQSDDETVTGLSLERYGSGTYMVRAANQRGGLGAATQEIVYVEQDKYTLTITQTEGAEAGYGWATICLPYNAKNPAPESLTLYAGTAVANYVMTLQPVDIINKNRGYVVYGKVGKYEFKSTSHTNNTETILEGNPSSESIDKGNNNCYVLANKPSTYGIGFYRYAGAMLAANKAWLPISKVGGDSEQSLQRAVLFRIKPGGITDIVAPHLYGTSFPSRIYDLNGVPVKTPIKGNIYIVDGQQRLW